MEKGWSRSRQGRMKGMEEERKSQPGLGVGSEGARQRWRDCTARVMDGRMKEGGKEGEKDGKAGDKHDN
ncbi:hypothetical protein E2C01_098698 [Portunus trituberculatus]|uniref:Uncharacterized protein n=1 Tax=Portunus trituberculatus TaxID=210409 RepID=A0A5B7K7L7_PORTR|nr:hypothetical protein [Portunus trituberculatus]